MNFIQNKKIYSWEPYWKNGGLYDKFGNTFSFYSKYSGELLLTVFFFFGHFCTYKIKQGSNLFYDPVWFIVSYLD